MGRQGIGFHNTNTIAAVGTVEVVPPPSKGYQECGLTGKAVGDESGLAGTTTYYIYVAINGGVSTEYSITTVATTTFTGIIALLTAAISGVTFSIVNGDFRCTSNSTAAGSAVELADGDTGTGLLATLTDFSALETAVKPSGGACAITGIDVGITAYADTGLLSITDGTNVWWGPWLCKDGNGSNISMRWPSDDPFMLPADKGLSIVCATANVGATCTVKGYYP
jgi:hypothetical protein